MAKFRTILCDPPWFFVTKTNDGRIKCPDMHYPCMTLADIANLPVSEIAEENAALLMWTTWAHMREAMTVIEAWGFVYRTGFPWVKMARQGTPRRGIGYHVAQCSEPLLIATRGSGVSPHQDEKREIGILFNPPAHHSAKPDQQYCVAERYPAPYLELFARPDGGLDEPRPNWTRAGNEIDGKDMRQALCDLAALPDIIVSALDTENTDDAPTDAQETLF